jgi:hypothetical protein
LINEIARFTKKSRRKSMCLGSIETSPRQADAIFKEETMPEDTAMTTRKQLLPVDLIGLTLELAKKLDCEIKDLETLEESQKADVIHSFILSGTRILSDEETQNLADNGYRLLVQKYKKTQELIEKRKDDLKKLRNHAAFLGNGPDVINEYLDSIESIFRDYWTD